VRRVVIVFQFSRSKKKRTQADPDFTDEMESTSTENDSRVSSEEETTDVEDDHPETMQSTRNMSTRRNAKNNKYDSVVIFNFL